LYVTGEIRVQGVVLRKIKSVVTSGHERKMAITPFDLPLPKTPCYTQSSPLYLAEPDLLPIDFFTLWK